MSSYRIYSAFTANGILGTPGYTIAGTPPQYGWMATQPGPYARSQLPVAGDVTQLSIGTGLNGASAYQRPVVNQNVDRWGNVVSCPHETLTFAILLGGHFSDSQPLLDCGNGCFSGGRRMVQACGLPV